MLGIEEPVLGKFNAFPGRAPGGSGHDVRDANAERTQFVTEGFGQGTLGVLADAVRRLARKELARGDRSHVDQVGTRGHLSVKTTY